MRSANEISGMVLKAARGAGMSIGCAEELGRAARKLIVNNYDLSSICLPKQLSWVESLV